MRFAMVTLISAIFTGATGATVGVATGVGLALGVAVGVATGVGVGLGVGAGLTVIVVVTILDCPKSPPGFCTAVIVAVPTLTPMIVLARTFATDESLEVNVQVPFEFDVGGTITIALLSALIVIALKAPSVGTIPLT